jgi:predicted metal-binding membrane protein
MENHATPQAASTVNIRGPANELSVRLKVQRVLTFLALTAIAAVGWYFLVRTESAMRVMRGDGFFMELMWKMMSPGEAMPYLGATALMWVVMMIAMMVPAVMPMLVVFRKLDRGASGDFDTFLFANGYLLAWSTFSIVAAVLQWFLHGAGWLHGDLLAVRPLAAGAILVAAGVYQLTPMKSACLDKCRSPMGFFLGNWRAGRWGAIRMGFKHGIFCVGCCWMLMLIMFVGGAMSVVTMALLTGFILAERVLPAGPWVARLPGAGLIVWGGYLATFA